MTFELPELPFDPTSFKDWTSAETFEYHHGKHHAGYVKKLNTAIENTEWTDQPLEKIVAGTQNIPSIFNNAAQHFNHSFFWNCLSSDPQEPSGQIAEMINKNFSSLNKFQSKFTDHALDLFGSGWVWLVKNGEKLEIAPYRNADTPIGTELTPLLTLDVWEHAYYIDFRNDRGKFIEGFWQHVNWEFVNKQL